MLKFLVVCAFVVAVAAKIHFALTECVHGSEWQYLLHLGQGHEATSEYPLQGASLSRRYGEPGLPMRQAFPLGIAGHSANKLASINSLHLSADPIHIPGNETIDVDIEILQRIADHHFQVKFDLFKHIFMGFMQLPCFKNLHNCTFELCTALGERRTHNCPAEIEESTPTFPCKCPIEPGRYHLNPTTFQIPVLSGLMQWLAEGEYKINAMVTDTNTNEEVACFNVQFSTEGECHNASCIVSGIFGRK